MSIYVIFNTFKNVTITSSLRQMCGNLSQIRTLPSEAKKFHDGKNHPRSLPDFSINSLLINIHIHTYIYTVDSA